ncbi:MAG: type VI secretion system contractile sheath small subunit [Janthinobacterium lividum]
MADGSVAPKERVNIVYKSDTGNAQEEVELPLKQLIIGDFSLRESGVPVESRKPIDINKDNFNSVLREANLALQFCVPNRLDADTDADIAETSTQLPVSLHFETLRDFEPDSIVENVPELKRLIELREALKALKGPLGNMPDFRKRLQQIVGDDSTREQLLTDLGIAPKEPE